MSKNSVTFSITNDALAAHETDCLVVTLSEGQLSQEAKELDKSLDGYLQSLINNGDLSGKIGSVFPLLNLSGIKAKRLLLVGLGKEDKFSPTVLKKIVTAATNWIKTTPSTNTTFALLGECQEKETSIPVIIESIGSALYVYDQYKSEKSPELKLKNIALFQNEVNDIVKNAVSYGAALVSGMNLTKDLGNAPGNKMTPSMLGNAAIAMANEFPSLNCTVMGKAEIEKLGMGSFLGVAQGSIEEPRFIVLEYLHGEKNDKPIVLVGKGVTFDTGGISLKPGAAMDEMKFDMCGAASVLGTFQALATFGMKINVVGIIAATENMPSGSAVKPGDVLTSMSGQTIEVLNTDAEGRLILCDALTYATRYEPKAIIDIATLTGAIIVALGHDVSGLFSNNEELADKIRFSAKKAQDAVWEFPIWEETFQSSLDSNFADMANISAGRGAGSITAACFLERFVEKYPWAHLDIAGTAWASGKEKGASGRPVPLLLKFLKQYEAN